MKKYVYRVADTSVPESPYESNYTVWWPKKGVYASLEKAEQKKKECDEYRKSKGFGGYVSIVKLEIFP